MNNIIKHKTCSAEGGEALVF